MLPPSGSIVALLRTMFDINEMRRDWNIWTASKVQDVFYNKCSPLAKSRITTATYDKPLRRPGSDPVRKCAITPSLIPVNVFVNHDYGDTVWCSCPFRPTALLELFPSIPNVIHVAKLGSE